jgi:hypothetical protein
VVGGIAATTGACGSFGSASESTSSDASVAADGAAGSDGGPPAADDGGGVIDLALCDPQKAFGVPAAFPAAIDGPKTNEFAGFLSSARTLYLASDRDGPTQIYGSTRQLPAGDKWSTPALVTELSANGVDARNPNLSRNELTIYFDSKRAGTAAIYAAKRASTTEPFGLPTLITLDGSRYNLQPWITKSALYFASQAPAGKLSIWFATSSATGFAAPVEVDELNSKGEVQSPVLTDDELTIFFSAPGTAGDLDIFTATRTKASDSFSGITRVDALSTIYNDYLTWVSANGCAVIAETFVQNKADLFYATRAP